MPTATIDCYTILGVAQDASVKDINAAYKRLALKLHPDKAGNDSTAIVRFQKVQDAVELLRDPSRRSRLDKSLDAKAKRRQSRSQYPDDDWSTCATDNDSEPSNTRERHETKRERRDYFHDYGFDGKTHHDTQGYHDRQHKRPFNDAFLGRSDTQKKRQRQQQPSPYGYGGQYSYTRYMYSYSNSVHMDTISDESKARKAQFKADNVQWAQERAGIDPNVERARGKAQQDLRITQMQARLARDSMKQQQQQQRIFEQEQIRRSMEELEKVREARLKSEKTLRNLQRQLDEKLCADAEAKRKTKQTENKAPPLRPLTPSLHNPEPFVSSFGYKSTRDLERVESTSTKFNKLNSDPIYFESNSSPKNIVGDTSNISSPASSSPASSRASSNCSTGCSDADQLSAKFASDRPTLSERLESTADKMIGIHMVSHEASLKPLVPFFKQKLADPLGRYKLEDLASELNGFVSEIYNDWIENIRSSIPDATPIGVRNNPELCAHLGAWHKDHCLPKCDTCNFWMPLFVLNCPGCGLKACVSCKFTGDAFIINRH